MYSIFPIKQTITKEMLCRLSGTWLKTPAFQHSLTEPDLQRCTNPQRGHTGLNGHCPARPNKIQSQKLRFYLTVFFLPRKGR